MKQFTRNPAIKSFNNGVQFTERTEFGKLSGAIGLILKYGYDIDDDGYTAMAVAKKYLYHVKHNHTAEWNAERIVNLWDRDLDISL